MTPSAGREQTAAGLDAILSPRSVAVVGASTQPGSVGHELLRSVLQGGFPGAVFAVNPHATEVLGIACAKTVTDLPTAPELAVVAVPAHAVVDVAEECGRKGVRGLVVVSAGFREADAAGAEREEALEAVVRRYGMRMVGPNCLGVINASARLHATFAPRPLLPGKTALVTQSGAVGIALLEHAARVGLGVSRFVSMGNKADVSGNDLLLLWEHDDDVAQVLMYLENVGNPRNFVRIARRFTKGKPIIVLKSGRTQEGARAAGSHTGALMQSDELVKAMLADCGVLRAESVDDLFHIAAATAQGRMPAGNRIGIVTNSGGPAILCVDRLADAGLRLATLGEATVEALRRLLPPESHAQNPVDLLAGAGPDGFRDALAALEADAGVDAVVAIWTPLSSADEATAGAIAHAIEGMAKPVAAVVFGHGPGTKAFDALAQRGHPTYAFPEHAVLSLGALVAMARWRSIGWAEARRFAVDGDGVARRLRAAEPDPEGWLPMREAFAVAQAYGIRFPAHAFAPDEHDVAAAAARLGFPVALKADLAGLVHKTEAGAVRLGLRDERELRAACQEMARRAKAAGRPVRDFLVMRMAPAGPDVLVGGLQDKVFGPVVAYGAGGVYTEILKDVRFQLAPVDPRSAAARIQALRIAPLLAGVRGEPARDVDALADCIARVAQLVADHPRILEAELNPVRPLPVGEGALALDVRIRLSDLARPKADAAAL